MTFTLGHANIDQRDPQSEELKTISLVTGASHVTTFNEARDAKGPIDALLGWDNVMRSGLAIAWRTAKFRKIDSGGRLVMQGGHVGADGTRAGPDNRRVGPGRHILWADLEELAALLEIIFATHHGPAKADTSAKWRRGIRFKAWLGVIAELRAAMKAHPNAHLILTGDFNTIGKIAVFAALGLTEVKTPATLGPRLRYDRVFISRGLRLSGVRIKATRSDHKALLAEVSLSGDPVPPLPDETPGPPPLPTVRRRRRPLNPWSRRGRRIRRRNRPRWRRIRRAWRRYRRRNR